MSAVYLHNSLYTQEVMEGRGGFPHSRNESSVSSTTGQTSTTLHSPPTEPLLPVNNASVETYYEDLARSPRPGVASPQLPHWGLSSPPEESTLIEAEKAAHQWKAARRRPTFRCHWVKISLETILGLWALYNAIRYFLAFTIYDSIAGQIVSLALGVSASLATAFLACAIGLAWIQPRLVLHGIPYKSISAIYWTLTYISLFFLFVPAVINFAMVFAWRNSADLQLRAKYRCQVDIDIIWSKTFRLCKGKAATWGVWVAISALRLLITSAIIFGYQFLLIRSRRPRLIKPKQFRGKHRHNRSDSLARPSPLPPNAGIPFPPAPPPRLDIEQRESEDSSLSSRTRMSPQQVRSTRSYSSSFSTDGRSTTEFPNSQISEHFQYQNTPLPVVHEHESDLGGFVDRFRTLVSQINRETDEALEFARSEDTSSRHTVESPLRETASPASLTDDEEDEDQDARFQPQRQHDDEEGDFYGSPSPLPPTLGYNEFGQPYPPEQQIQMLNGYIRRMPTIESMGSREMGSSIAASSLLARDHDHDNKRNSTQTNRSYNSRPPTRNTLLSWVGSDLSAGSEPSSRTNSLTVQVERLAALGFLTGGGPVLQGSSELGELFEAVQGARTVPPHEGPAHLDLNLGLLKPGWTSGEEYQNSTAGSRSTNVSYHTATTGSAKTGIVPRLEDDVPAVPPLTSSGFSSSTSSTIPAHPLPSNREDGPSSS